MTEPTRLRLLLVEDSSEDAELLDAALRRAGYAPEIQRVQTAEQMRAALDSGPFDLIVADWTLPRFGGLSALRIVRLRRLDVPFVILSGTITEDMAVTAMKAGAHDYVMKDNMARLAPAIRRELGDAEARRRLRGTEELLRRASLTDALTGLPNRTLFMDRLRLALERSRRPNAGHVALICLKLDNLDIVQDVLDHARVDQILAQVARRLADSVRAGETVSRLGAREFGILLDGFHDPAAPARLAFAAQDRLSQSFDVGDHPVFLTASAGIALSDGPATTPEDLLRNAHTALHRAREGGPGQRVVFEASMHESARARLRLEADLRHALSRQEFRLRYQPIVALRDGAIAGFEALVRWQHPSRGLLLPEDFVHAAEANGLIIPLGDWVLREACRQARVWHRAIPKSASQSVSVNLSGRQFTDPDLERRVSAILKDTGLEPPALHLEITETVVMSDAPAAAESLSRLKALQCGLQVDDFGTGYSSLSYLHRFPIDTLKIDRSFIRRLDSDPGDLEIVRAIVALARALKLEIVAEGVETAEQRTMLADLGVTYGQGHLFAAALEPGEATGLLATERPFAETA